MVSHGTVAAQSNEPLRLSVGGSASPSQSAYHPSPDARVAASPMAGGEMSPRHGPRFILGATDTSQLTESDAIAVRNLEIFAVDHPQAVDNLGNRLGLGLVGIRCIHCIGTGTIPRSVIFPRSLQEVGDCIREVSEWHLGKCPRAPEAVRRPLEQALQRRHKAKHDGGSAWSREEQHRSRLLNFCNVRCRELRLVENYPPRTGLMFSYFPQASPRGDGMPFEEAKQSPRPASVLDDEFADLPFDDLQPVPFMVPDQNQANSFDSVPANFPFKREPDGDWVCKFCQQLHPQFRDVHFRWSSSTQRPPPADFIDTHLNQCRMYQQSLLQDYRGPLNPVALPNPVRPPPVARESVTPTSSPLAEQSPTAVSATGEGRVSENVILSIS